MFRQNTLQWRDCRHRISYKENAAREYFTKTFVLNLSDRLLFRRILSVSIWVVQQFIDHTVRQRLGGKMCQQVCRSSGHFVTVNQWVFQWVIWFWSYWGTDWLIHWLNERDNGFENHSGTVKGSDTLYRVIQENRSMF